MGVALHDVCSILYFVRCGILGGVGKGLDFLIRGCGLEILACIGSFSDRGVLGEEDHCDDGTNKTAAYTSLSRHSISIVFSWFLTSY